MADTKKNIKWIVLWYDFVSNELHFITRLSLIYKLTSKSVFIFTHPINLYMCEENDKKRILKYTFQHFIIKYSSKKFTEIIILFKYSLIVLEKPLFYGKVSWQLYYPNNMLHYINYLEKKNWLKQCSFKILEKIFLSS